MAWLGLSALALREDRVEASLDFGVLALQDAGDDLERRAEVLVNIGQAALRTGYPRITLDATQWIIRHRVHERTRSLAIGVAAVAAARLGRISVVRRCLALAHRETSTSGLPYPTAFMWSLIARATGEAGLASESRNAARRAHAMAASFGFEGIEAEADRLLTTGGVSPAVSNETISQIETALAVL
jgi:hypothetical protein